MCVRECVTKNLKGLNLFFSYICLNMFAVSAMNFNLQFTNQKRENFEFSFFFFKQFYTKAHNRKMHKIKKEGKGDIIFSFA